MQMNAADTRQQINAEDNQIRMVVSTLYNHILRDYIANVNEHKVMDMLYRFYTESNLALISKQQLRVYKELEHQSLSLSAFDIKKEK